MSNQLRDLAKTIRSKNADVDHVTFDIILRDRQTFERVRDSGVLSTASVARLFGIETDRVADFTAFEPANAIKWHGATGSTRSAGRFSIRRIRPSGSPGESDMFGCQQYAPLFFVEIP